MQLLKNTKTETVKLSRLLYFVHIQRMEENGIPTKMYYI